MGPRWLPDGRRESGRIAALAVSCPSLLNYLKPRIVPEGGEREREREREVEAMWPGVWCVCAASCAHGT